MTQIVTGNSRGQEPARRDVIASAADRCFTRWGVVRTRMEDVAREAGLARPVLYRYFENKDALVAEVMVRHIRRRAEEIHERVRCEGPAAPLFVEVLRSGVEGDRETTASGLLGDGEVHRTARLIATSPEVSDAMADYWRPYLEHARQRGELREGVDDEQAVRWLTLIVFHFLTLPETVPPGEELTDYLRTFVVAALVAES